MSLLKIKSAFLLVFLVAIHGSLHHSVSTNNTLVHRLSTISGCDLQQSSHHSSSSVQVFLTISSLSYVTEDGIVITRQAEINWNAGSSKPGDQVALYNRDPTKTEQHKPLVVANASSFPDGHFRTDVKLPYMYFNYTHASGESCLGLYVAYITAGEVSLSSCLKTRPFWMHENKKYLEHQTLANIMIPGSHDSGCFSPFMGKSTDTLMRYKYAQEEPILNQLMYGLRYFDFRVGFYNNTKDKYYINHSYFRTDHSIEAILSQVKTFLDFTQEIVILDFHLFPVGFDSDSIHARLMKMIYISLGSHMIPYNQAYRDATIGELWGNGKRVLVSYNDDIRMQESHGVLWPALPRAWGNKQHPKDLKTYLDNVFAKPSSNTLWAVMAELTPNSIFIVSHPRTGLRKMADEINRNVTRWFRDHFWRKANIVATDYFLGNNIIEVSINANKLKHECMSKNTYKHT